MSFKRGYSAWAVGALTLWGSGAFAQGILNPTKVTSSSSGSVRAHQEEDAHGAKPRVAVETFTDKSARGWAHIGEGMADQLVTALDQTGAFIVLERAALDAVLAEQDLANSDRFDKSTAPQMGKLEGADFKIIGAVTEYDESQASVGVGVRSRSAAVGAAGNQAHIAIDLRMIDMRTGRIASSTSVEGSPRDLAGGIGGRFSKVLLGFNAQYRTPREKAVRACIIRAVDWISAYALKDGVIHSNGVAAPPAAQAGASASVPPRGAASGPSPAAAPSSASKKDEPRLRAKSDGKLRFKPDPKSVVVGSVKSGDPVTLLEEQGPFVKVRLGSGKSGWIEQSAVAESD